jgi:hypothetical protein
VLSDTTRFAIIDQNQKDKQVVCLNTAVNSAGRGANGVESLCHYFLEGSRIKHNTSNR